MAGDYGGFWTYPNEVVPAEVNVGALSMDAIFRNLTLDCPECGEPNPVTDRGYSDLGMLWHRVWWLKAVCPEHGQYTARNARVGDIDVSQGGL